jgi:hypothetical protein
VDFDNLKDLERYLRAQIGDVMETELSEEVKTVMQQAITETVYDSYDPKIYQRRSVGGLGDRNNIHAEMVGEMSLEVSNIAPLNNAYGRSPGRNLSEIIISGDGYLYDGDFRYPRDFIGATEESLEQTNSFERVMRQGLNKRGIDVV